VAETPRVIAGPVGPAVGEPPFSRSLRAAEDAREHVDPPRHVPNGLADVVAAIVSAPLERVLVESFDSTAESRGDVLEPFRHQLGVAHRPSLWGRAVRPPDRHPARGLRERNESVPRVETVRVARREKDVAQTLQVGVRHYRVHELLADALAAMLREDEDVAEPRERRPIRHHPRERHLPTVAIGIALEG